MVEYVATLNRSLENDLQGWKYSVRKGVQDTSHAPRASEPVLTGSGNVITAV